MTNLKKTLAVVLAFAMMLSMGSVFAYSDVEEGTTVSEAVGILSNLDILTGFEDGTFRPDETVTRAQMAAIICRMLGYEDQAQSSMGSTVFNDVAADHWASGYVNVTQAQGIINGYGDGNFGPEDKVTYEQAIKMIVSALGYDLAAARKGGYPTGYLAIASAEGITKKANGKVGDAAARATIAVLVYNALDVQLMDQTSWSSEGDDRYSQTDDTVLSKYLEVTMWEGTVTATPTTLVAGKKYDPEATPKATIEGFYWSYQNDKKVKIYDVDKAGNSVVFNNTVNADKVDTNAYLGKSVIAYIGDDAVTGKATIFAIVENETKNESIKISTTQLDKAGDKYYSTPNTVGYKEVGATKSTDVTLDANVIVYKNYVKQTGVNTTQAIANLATKGGSVELISNDADSDIEVVVVTAYDGEAVIETAEEANGVYKFDTYKGRLGRVDSEDEDTMVAVYKDGEVATVADIAANDTVSYVNIATGFDIFFVSSATVTGAVEARDDANKTLTIAGEEYEVSVASGLASKLKNLSGEEGTFFLNVDGQIAYNETAPTVAGNYALVLASYTSTSGVESGDYLQVVLADGTLAEYQIGKNAKVVDDAGNDVTSNVKAYYDAKLTGTKANVAGAKFAQVSDFGANNTLVAKLAISNDKITKVRLLPGNTGSASATDKFDAEAMSAGRLDLSDDTVIFAVKETTGIIDPENIVIGTPADFFVDDELINGSVVAYDEDKTYGAAVGFGLTKAIDVESDVFVVTAKKTTVIDDVEAYVLTGVQAGEEVTVTVYNEDGFKGVNDPAKVDKGDVLLLAEPNADGYVSEIAVLLDYTAAATASRYDSKVLNKSDDIFSGYGKVEYAGDTKFGFAANVTNDFDGTTVEYKTGIAIKDANGDITGFTGDAQSYREAANYVLFDYTESTKNPDVSVEDGSDWLFDTQYESYTYVRYVDGRLADVVVYRIKKV